MKKNPKNHTQNEVTPEGSYNFFFFNLPKKSIVFGVFLFHSTNKLYYDIKICVKFCGENSIVYSET